MIDKYFTILFRLLEGLHNENKAIMARLSSNPDIEASWDAAFYGSIKEFIATEGEGNHADSESGVEDSQQPEQV